MGKQNVLSLLGLFVGGLLSLGDGVVVGAPLLLASTYLLVRTESEPTRERLTAAVVGFAR